MSSFKFGSALLPVVVGLGLLIPHVAAAQDSFDAHVADIQLLKPRAVQNDVGISEKQRARLNIFVDKLTAETGQYQKDQQRKGVPASKLTPQDPQVVAYVKEFRSNIIKTLTPGQLKRLREITLQARGYEILLDPVVQRRLSITSAELTKIRAAVEEFSKYAQQSANDAYMGVRAQYQNVHPKDQADTERLNKEFSDRLRTALAGIRPRVQQAHLKMDQQVEAALSRPQRANWIAMLGKSFKMPGQ